MLKLDPRLAPVIYSVKNRIEAPKRVEPGSLGTSIAVHRAITEAVGVLRGGGVAAFPTDTLYGLGADASCVEAVTRVFQIKGRPSDMGLPLLLGAIWDLEQLAIDIPDVAWTLAERFWPGPLTLILRKSLEVPDAVTGGRDSVGVRMPDHCVPLTLVRELGRPITGTSANPSGSPDAATAADVRRLLGDRLDYIVDGGTAPAGRPSTIVDVTESRPQLIRVGAIDRQTLQSVSPLPLDVPRTGRTLACG